jgi:uncharacterized membrane protein YebE (DUF533 family)
MGAGSRANTRRMGVGDLSESEQVVLLSLVGLLARADGQVSEAEMSTLEALRENNDPERFERVRDAASALDSPDAILQAAGQIKRAEATQVIYGLLLGMAIPDTISETEATLLERLATMWGLEGPLEE